MNVSNYFSLTGNYRSVIKDCEKAFELKPDYTKAIKRAIDSAKMLKSWDEMFSWCERGLQQDPANAELKALRLQAVKEKVSHSSLCI